MLSLTSKSLEDFDQGKQRIENTNPTITWEKTSRMEFTEKATSVPLCKRDPSLQQDTCICCQGNSYIASMIDLEHYNNWPCKLWENIWIRTSWIYFSAVFQSSYWKVCLGCCRPDREDSNPKLLMRAALNCWKGNLLLLFEGEIVKLPSPKIQYSSYACIILWMLEAIARLSILVNIRDEILLTNYTSKCFSKFSLLGDGDWYCTDIHTAIYPFQLKSLYAVFNVIKKLKSSRTTRRGNRKKN